MSVNEEPRPLQRSLIPPKAEATREIVPFTRDGGTGELLAPDLVKALVLYGQKYSLDPYAGELIYFYNQPYVTERGAVHNAIRSGRYRGHAVSLVPAEERKAMGLADNDYVYRCEVWVKDVEEPVAEFGEVTWKEVQEALERYKDRAQYLPIVKSPGKMARARAIRRAHLLAFPLKGGENAQP